MTKNHTLIIGGTKGTGAVIAEFFEKKGDTVSVIGRTRPENEKIDFFELDLEKTVEINNIIYDIIKKNGKIKNLIFSQRYRSKKYDWKGEMKVSLTSTKEIIEACLDNFTSQVSIVIISSVASIYIVDDQPLSYHVAKAGLNKMVDYYAVKLEKKGIRVNGILPGTIDKGVVKKENESLKKIVPLKKMITPKEIADIIYFLCSEKALNLTGQKIILDGGISLIQQESLIKKDF